MLSLSCTLQPPLQNASRQQWRWDSLVMQASSGKRGNDDYHATLKALNSRELRIPRKSLGQHYMLNSSINEHLSSIAEVEDGDVVLEIGPGTGSLTNVLLNAGATVIAVEKDPHMTTIMKDRFGCKEQLTVLQEDITRCHIRSSISTLIEKRMNARGVLKRAKVVSNIPFNITTDVIKLLLPLGDLFSNVILLLQDETALRLTDIKSDSSEYRPINLFVNFYCNAEYKFKVERTNFFPQPNVDAAVVKFDVKQKSKYPKVSSTKGFFSMGLYLFFSGGNFELSW